MAEEIENVKAVVGKAQAIDILEIDPEDVIGFEVEEFRAPVVIVLEIVGVQLEWLAGGR
jgi:hypothetical protein